MGLPSTCKAPVNQGRELTDAKSPTDSPTRHWPRWPRAARPKARSRSGSGINADRPAVTGDQGGDDRKAQPRPAIDPVAGGISSVKPFEYPGCRLSRQAGALVGNGQRHRRLPAVRADSGSSVGPAIHRWMAWWKTGHSSPNGDVLRLRIHDARVPGACPRASPAPERPESAVPPRSVPSSTAAAPASTPPTGSRPTADPLLCAR